MSAATKEKGPAATGIAPDPVARNPREKDQNMTTNTASPSATPAAMITRRAALAGLASLPAVAGAGGALAASRPQEPEQPIDRVHRLAEELSDALETWEAQIEATGYPHAIECTVHAARRDGIRPIRFSPIRYFTPDQRVANAQHELIAATKALHPDVSDWRVLRPEDDRGRTVGMFFLIGHPERLS